LIIDARWKSAAAMVMNANGTAVRAKGIATRRAVRQGTGERERPGRV